MAAALQPATAFAAWPDGEHVLTLAGYIGHLRLCFGMVRANRPWRLALRLADMLVVAESVF